MFHCRHLGPEPMRAVFKLLIFLWVWKFNALSLEILYRALNSFPPTHPLQRLPHKRWVALGALLFTYFSVLVSSVVGPLLDGVERVVV